MLYPENKRSVTEALFMMGELTSEIRNNERKTISYLTQFIHVSKKPQGIDVTWSRVYEMLGNAYFVVGNYEDAISAFRAALQYNPDHPWGLSLYYRIACSHYHERDYDNVIMTIERMLQVALRDNHPIEEYRVYDLLGNAFFAQHQYPNAVEAYTNALKLLPATADHDSEKIRSYLDLALKFM
jgi:tetratricopeptide (TPR) repeat protein